MKESESVMIIDLGVRCLVLTFNAAGFIATRTWHLSPDVKTLCAPMCT